MGLKRGDRVRITCINRSWRKSKELPVDGWIILASDNEVSLMLGFEAWLAGHVGMMPVIFRDGCYRSIINGVKVRIEKQEIA